MRVRGSARLLVRASSRNSHVHAGRSIGVAYRHGLQKAKLQNESKTLSVDGGTPSAAEGSVALGYTF